MNDEVYRRSGESERLAGIHGEGLSIDGESTKTTPEKKFELDKTLSPDASEFSDEDTKGATSGLRKSPFAERIKRVKESTAKIWSLMTQKGRSVDE